MKKVVQALKLLAETIIFLIMLGAVGGYERDTLSLTSMALIIGTSIILMILVNKEIKQ